MCLTPIMKVRKVSSLCSICFRTAAEIYLIHLTTENPYLYEDF